MDLNKETIQLLKLQEVVHYKTLKFEFIHFNKFALFFWCLC